MPEFGVEEGTKLRREREAGQRRQRDDLRHRQPQGAPVKLDPTIAVADRAWDLALRTPPHRQRLSRRPGPITLNDSMGVVFTVRR